ncbi:hypothetical protein SD37_35360 [Amycolatopsis orientalis]|uniref:Secreted protein n=1 Tax=Amycolatopsis orientalis TaxID=31958 RepID=A0A193C7C6_AMYOR|nr:hypothetical protein [Amycolatopsis orientalis]ANN20349.1 hypothetical protein SD37_35360 [Amycolatopsis orientalis]
MHPVERTTARRSLGQRIAVTVACTAATIAPLLVSAPSAQAGEVHFAGPFWKESVCLDEQHTYVRYYRIVKACYRPNGTSWGFEYTERT